MIQFSDITSWIHETLSGLLSPGLTFLAELVLAGVAVLAMVLVFVVIFVYMERKVAGFMQLRYGPNRVGIWGSLQVIADVFKLLLKESFAPDSVDKLLFNLAPYLVLAVSFMALAPISWAPGLQMWDTNIGVLFISAVSSIGVIGILMAGWSSNNKYSLIGAMRSGAQIVSYELSAGLSILAVVAMCGSLSVHDIIQSQADGWWIFKGHLPIIFSFVVYVIASTAECNRAPFDLAEAESELTAGYHTEYSGMGFGIFYLTEYINMLVVAMVASTVFLGGWLPFHIYGFEAFNHVMNFIPSWIWFFGKIFFIIFLIMWFRWTFPRLRIDQLLKLEWKYLLPLSIVNLVIVAFITIMGWHF
ncbi:MAG: NADH-quinone oxidoreductase subunit NuoH [Bacteroidota bacterium]|nr:NADH-quinone oxidoreductase subunit NuoH [Bacteroidota bacterium]